MTKLPAVGRVEDPQELDLDPIEIPVVGYTLRREEAEETFSFRPVQPAGATIDILLSLTESGSVPVPKIMGFLQECLVTSDRDRWNDFLNDPDIMVEQSTLAQLYQALMEVYANRPTLRSSASGGGGRPVKRTSTAARAARASASRRKP